MLRCWVLGIRHRAWKNHQYLNYPLPITHYQPTRQYKHSSELDYSLKTDAQA
ncbi:hypothetical protein [Fischerella thermalis]|uniref:hypothetical protein n=1 Tax=Fischerella thermalis TaxID=372787 RepID=UPI001CA570EC|nr:hypothetical protein [Fischerella thermalis]